MTTLFVGDVHGCAKELASLLKKVRLRPKKDRLLLVGDAFSRGPAPRTVWDQIEEFRVEMVLGNHDDRLLRQLCRWAEGKDPKFGRPEQRYTFAELVPVVDQLLPWLHNCPLYIDERKFLMVHAGINPEGGLEATTREEFLHIRTWPATDGTCGPRWYEYYEPSDQLLVFGHDAPGGVVERRHNPKALPYLIGLDSGCVYGGKLSGYLLDEDEIVQVKSRRDYAPKGQRQSSAR